MIKIDMPESVEYILDILHKNKFEAYIVGGCVRDSLLNRNPKDWDITTNAKPEEIKSIFDKTIDTGIKHGTVTVVLNKENFEVTTYRIDGEYKDNRIPKSVNFTCNLKEDLSRRDFTINAMAYNYKEGLIDYYNGVEDLNNKMIACVGNPIDRFNEDALRMLRAIRFSCQLGFDFKQNIVDTIIQFNKNISNISMERINDELCKILISNNPIDGIYCLLQSGLMYYIIPELELCLNFNQYNPNHDKDVFWHTMSVLENTEDDLILRLAALFHDIGKPNTFTIDEYGVGHFYQHHLRSADITEEVMKRLKFPNKTIEQVKVLVREHMSRYDKLRINNIKKFINRIGIDNLDRLFKLQIADIKGSIKRDDISKVLELKNEIEKVLNEKHPLTVKDLAINGTDLIELGFIEGKQIGAILKELLEIVIDNPELNNKEELINKISRMRKL